MSVSGARGYPATDSYKGVAGESVGWRGSYTQVIIGMDAARKAKRQGEALLERGRLLLRGSNLGEFLRADSDVVGAETSYGGFGQAGGAREVMMRASADHPTQAGAGLFVRECLASTSAMAPGSTATVAGAVTPLTRLFLFLMPKAGVTVTAVVGGRRLPVADAQGRRFDPQSIPRPLAAEAPELGADAEEVPLVRLAWGRSGDKGNLFNVAAIARRPDYLPFIRASLTKAALADRFAHLYAPGGEIRVSAYEVPGVNAINFVLHGSMDGGILMSPQVDSAAKGMAQQLLEMPVRVPAGLLIEASGAGAVAEQVLEEAVGG